MTDLTRRKFLLTSSVLLAASFTGSGFDLKKKKPLLAFSTLGCPDWSFEKITHFAVQNNYKGIELRGIQRELDLTKCKEFSTATNRSATIRMMKEKGLRFVDLGSSANLHFADAAVRQKNLDEAKRFIDLAQQIGCANIRVFPNLLPKNQDANKTMDLIANGLLHLGEYAMGSNVYVLMETHGDLVKSDDVEKIMKAAEHKHVGLVWDVTNMWTITKEFPAAVYKKLKRYIRHTHIKDAKVIDGKVQYTLLGQGEVPIFEAIDLLTNGGYKGYYSFEWEKLWHPEIEDPEVSFADYAAVMKKHFNN
ncbi:MAG TPA: sugar phosphate isomerase/epimerase family protein [Chitinophagaceae bacterium]|nr:sugar phosphate isomerase/epimerase family protein [Chitinophagaceae bacterium]